jgi:hypothetical protein
MQKELDDAASAGFVFSAVMGGESAFGGNEVVVIMSRDPGAPPAKRTYRLLATSKTSTMQKEMQRAADEGFVYRGQTVFKSLAGEEVGILMERVPESDSRLEYRLLATAKTSTMQKELAEAGAAGFQLVGMTVGQTAFGGNEVVCIMARPAAK